MGQLISSPSLPSADPRVPYFALTFQAPDKIILILADIDIIDITRKAILESASAEELDHDSFLHCECQTDMNTYEFKFRGFPFMRGCNHTHSLRTMKMCCLMLEMYCKCGWTLDLSSDLSRGKETTTWFFQYGQSQKNVLQKRKNILCVCVNSGDTISLVNAPERIRRYLALAIKRGFGNEGIQREILSYCDVYEIEMPDAPWFSHDPGVAVNVRRALLEIIKLFEIEGGYRFYGTVNTKGTSDTLFFVEDDETLQADCSYFGISLTLGGRIVVIDPSSSEIVEAVLRAIVKYWPSKLHSQTIVDDRRIYEFRLKGNPWYETGGEESTAARIFLCGLLEILHVDGYEPLVALDVTRGLNDKATIVLRSKNWPAQDRNARRKSLFLLRNSSQPYWCISLQDESKIRLIGAPEMIRPVIRHVIDQLWPWGLQKEHSYSDEGYVFKLRSGPWGAEQHENIAALMTFILKVLNDHGCRSLISADVTGRFISNNHGGSHSLDVHSWIVTSDAKIDRQRLSNASATFTIQRKDEEDEEETNEFAPLRSVPSPSQTKERPTRKISAFEYSSYVLSKDEDARRDSAIEEKDTVSSSKDRGDTIEKKTRSARRKISAFERSSSAVNTEY